MCPPAPVPPHEEELFTSLDKFTRGSPLPANVIADINPYQYKPENLPDGIWYLVRSGEKRETEHGFWRAKAERCEIFKNSSLTGWRTTLEFYKGQAPHGQRTDWVMQEYEITRKGSRDEHKLKDFSLLCRVFRSDGHSLKPEMHSNHGGADATSGNHFHSMPLTAPNTEQTSGQGSTSRSQVIDRNNQVEPLAVPERLLDVSPENLSELESIVMRGDFLELADLDGPEPSSGECFDSLALLRDVSDEHNQDQHAKGSSFKLVSEAARPNEVVLNPATFGSVISCSQSEFRGEGTQFVSAVEGRFLEKRVPEHAVKTQKGGHNNEGTSNSCNVRASSSSGCENPVSKGEEKALGRMKNIMKKYMPF